MAELSRNETILESILRKEEYTGVPQSRVEALLIRVANLINAGGASQEQIEAAIYKYLRENPLEAYDDTDVINRLEEIERNINDIPKSGVHVGSEAPTDPNVDIWIKPDGDTIGDYVR